MKGSSTRLLAAALLISCFALLISAWNSFKIRKTGYVDTIRLFNEYKMKLDLEKKEDAVLLKIKSDADSLKNIHDMLMKAQGKDTMSIRHIEIQIAALSGNFNEEYTRSNKAINDEVWKRLNPEIDEFAKDKGLDLLIGANGMGTVLYGSKDKDMTSDLIRFVNEKYTNGN
ncbi:MAG: OmpH family outer membrane protein [Bacteroidetes bacterium]|nr:OmpH family outer membrane protein [Bacteroidota bacterium]